MEFSLRAGEPVFASVRSVLGDDVVLRLQPDWRADQAEAVQSICASEDRDVFVAVAESRPVRFVAVAMNAFRERTGSIEIIGVDPDYQRRGISSDLTKFAIEHMRSQGTDIAVVEAGGDPGHAPARAAYDAARFTPSPSHAIFACSADASSGVIDEQWRSRRGCLPCQQRDRKTRSVRCALH